VSRPVVLVHGAYHGAWCWAPVTEHLVDRGATVHAVELPFTSLADDIVAVRWSVEDAGDGAVVVAHSYGGLVATLAASGLGNVAHLVYVAAHMLDVRSVDGARLLAAFRRAHGEWDPATAPFTEVHARMYHDCPVDEARQAHAQLRSTPTRSLAEMLAAARTPAYADTPSTYVTCTDDRLLDPDLQHRMSAKATHTHELTASHAPFLSAPAALAALVPVA
jgi:pimeloyl-ACP methyl ester carboxylesterase